MTLLCSMLLVFAVLVRDILGDEPQCSKFDFEEKLLEKVVRMEFQMNRLTSEITQAVEKIVSTRNTVESTLKDIARERDSLTSDIIANISALQEQVTTHLDRSIKEIHALTDGVLRSKLLFRAIMKSSLAVKTGDVIVFPDVLHNVGAYDPSTSIFTAATNDTYVFTVRLCLQNNKAVKPAVMIDGMEEDVYTFYTSAWGICFTAETVLILREDQKVWLQVNYAEPSAVILSDDTRRNTFTGRVL